MSYGKKMKRSFSIYYYSYRQENTYLIITQENFLMFINANKSYFLRMTFIFIIKNC